MASTTDQDKQFVQLAITKAKESAAQGGFPAGAVVVNNGKVVGEGIAIGNQLNDPSSHPEMVSIREACKTIQTSNLSSAVLYASMQPCLMCFGASMWSSISRIVYACSKEKVSGDYYGGNYKISEINKQVTRPIELVHFSEFEDESLEIIHKWENLVR